MDVKPLDISAQQHLYFPLLQQLYPYLTEYSFESLITPMVSQGYNLIGLFDEEVLVAVAGYAICYNLYDGKHLYLYDLVVDANIRSRGYGEKMIEALTTIAQQQTCTRIVLCSKFERIDAIRFYTEKMNFEKLKFVIQKTL